MRSKGKSVFQAAFENHDDQQEQQEGTYVKPTLIELDDVSELKKEIFGPVLHVVRFKRDELEALVEQINAAGYGLSTWCSHSYR
ncbi:aldehyde dehydrogenase family protein [Providencia hangzhouensis]|uniref:aldehyde dehydrogenase family protein n=1 Tax=Providencia hangzhouensis TaxID=3031799 RepID=UPI0034DD4CB5